MSIKLGIASLGSVGRVVAERVSRDLPEYTLVAASARDQERAKEYLEEHCIAADIVQAGDVSRYADIVIECAPASIYREIAVPVLEAGKVLVTLSAGALVKNWDLVEVARTYGAQILVPSGAILGLDAVQGVAQGPVRSVKMVTRKPVAGLRNAPFVLERGINVDQLSEPKKIFAGSAREAIEGFPANLNVAIALSLAGVGPDRTEMEVWVDPDIARNTHRVIVDAEAAHLDLEIQNVPSENPATGQLTALSVIALLRKLVSPLRVGT